jgi:hypothetical protein
MTPRAVRGWVATVPLALLLLAGGSPAQTVYRCGPDGRTYSQAPCPEGRAVDVGDARSDAQRREAAQVTRRQDTLGRSMEGDRLARESAPPAGAATLSAAARAPQAAASSPTKTSRKKKPRPRAAEPEGRTTVVVPAKPRKPASP